MSTLPEAIARLREFRRSFEDGEIDEETCLTTDDIDLVLEEVAGGPEPRLRTLGRR